MSVDVDDSKMMRQVLLRRPIESGHAEDVFWIENDIAKKGKRVCDEDGIIWTIQELYVAKSFKDIEKHRAAWKRFADILDDH